MTATNLTRWPSLASQYFLSFSVCLYGDNTNLPPGFLQTGVEQPKYNKNSDFFKNRMVSLENISFGASFSAMLSLGMSSFLDQALQYGLLIHELKVYL